MGFLLTNCGGNSGLGTDGGSGGGSMGGDTSGLAQTVFGYASLQSTEAIMLKQTLSQLSTKISILASSSPSQLGSATRAQSIASALQGIANNLVGVMPRNIDASKFAHFATMIGPQYYQYAFIPVVTSQMIKFQAAYVNLLVQYMGQVISQLREADIKNLLAVLQTSVQSLSSVSV